MLRFVPAMTVPRLLLPLVVLPFVNSTGEARHDFLADSITEIS
jgi:TolB-like protein